MPGREAKPFLTAQVIDMPADASTIVFLRRRGLLAAVFALAACESDPTPIVQDTAAGAGDFLASPSGYITMDTLEYLGQPPLYNRALVTVSENGDDNFHIRDVGAHLKDKLEKSGTPVV